MHNINIKVAGLIILYAFILVSWELHVNQPCF